MAEGQQVHIHDVIWGDTETPTPVAPDKFYVSAIAAGGKRGRKTAVNTLHVR